MEFDFWEWLKYVYIAIAAGSSIRIGWHFYKHSKDETNKNKRINYLLAAAWGVAVAVLVVITSDYLFELINYG